MNKEELYALGKKLFSIIGDEINSLDIRKKEEFRREVDFEELCIALALTSKLNVILFEALDNQSLGDFEGYSNHKKRYPTEKTIKALMQGEKLELGKSEMLRRLKV